MKEHTTVVALTDLPGLARELLVTLETSKDAATVLALTGDLGAGKTTFVKTLAKELGVTESVTSPTFTIMKGYETTDEHWRTLLHMDAYRIEELSELRPLQFAQLLEQPQTLFCIEWAEQIAEALPTDAVWIHFENTDDEETRSISISSKNTVQPNKNRR